MKITLRKNEALAIRNESLIIAVIRNPTLAKLRTAIMDHLVLEDAAICSPPENYDSFNGEQNLTYQCQDDVRTFFIEVEIFPLILY